MTNITHNFDDSKNMTVFIEGTEVFTLNINRSLVDIYDDLVKAPKHI